MRLVSGDRAATGVTDPKGRQLLLRLTNGLEQCDRVERGELLAQLLFDRFVNCGRGEQPLTRSERRMIALTHQRAVALLARQLE